VVGQKGSFFLVAFLNANVVETPLYVELGKVFSILQEIDHFQDKWERITILNSMFVQLPIVLHRSKTAILFLDKEEG
jgi:hypothetical protein